MLGMERSGLARNLKPMARKGLVTVAPGQDRRTRFAEITRTGNNKLHGALPKWHQAQAELMRLLGADRAAILLRVLSSLQTALKEED
jgi:DNA-binding MarR family transcriptional regulator